MLFSLGTAGTYTVLHVFSAKNDGSGPRAQLALDKQGNLYGTTGGGGANGGGTLWEYTTSGRFRTLHSFGAGADGTVPMQGPTASGHGTIYGSTAEGAIGGSGNIFSYGHAGGYDVLYDFMSGADGHCPFSGVAVGKAGALFGTTVGVGYGGNPNGSVWTYTAGGGLRTLYVFSDGADGEWPTQAPAIDGAGDVFGTTSTQNGSGFAGVGVEDRRRRPFFHPAQPGWRHGWIRSEQPAAAGSQRTSLRHDRQWRGGQRRNGLQHRQERGFQGRAQLCQRR